ncbi:uncharacterized protein LOC129248823 [Anastrepha obliqua]|uniref:uncharacterized protein LOC129248823 n=1 Tax=Anastrepha obliqua TaxID=95512 RepID=UPI002409A23B|nr:uncharacterized protein LOC129248823 [Anastrepha obliqua]
MSSHSATTKTEFKLSQSGPAASAGTEVDVKPSSSTSVPTATIGTNPISRHHVAMRRTGEDTATGSIIIGILHEGDPEGRIPRAYWKLVQAALTNMTLKALLSNQVRHHHVLTLAANYVNNKCLPTAGWKFVKAFDNTTTVGGVVTKRATTQVILLLTNNSLEPLAKSEGIINYGFDKVRVRTYKTDADAIDQLPPDIEANDAEEDPMESSSDVKNIDLEGYCSTGSELTARLKNMSTKRELLSESQEDENTNSASSSNKSAP